MYLKKIWKSICYKAESDFILKLRFVKMSVLISLDILGLIEYKKTISLS